MELFYWSVRSSRKKVMNSVKRVDGVNRYFIPLKIWSKYLKLKLNTCNVRERYKAIVIQITAYLYSKCMSVCVYCISKEIFVETAFNLQAKINNGCTKVEIIICDHVYMNLLSPVYNSSVSIYLYILLLHL